MKTPTTDEIENLHKKYAPGEAAFKLVFVHSQIVWKIAETIILKNNLKINGELIQAGCLLHDIGVYPLVNAEGKEFDPSKYITHGILGEEILKKEGFSETLCRFASHHTGVGLTLENIMREQLPLPPADYTAQTLEERLVMYADKFHSKFMPCFNSFAWYKNHVATFGDDTSNKLEKLAEEFGKPDLAPLIKKYGHSLRS